MNDREIYIRDPDVQAVENWLNEHFERVHLVPSPNGKVFSGQGERGDRYIPIKLFLGAVGRYASLCFDSEATPWDSDLSCARDAWRVLGNEIRCATDGWQEGTGVEDELWWRLDERGEAQVKWQV